MHKRLVADAADLPFEDGSVDTIITDPPWFFNFRGSSTAKSVRATNYAMIDDEGMEYVFGELHRVLVPGGHLYTFVPERKLRAAIQIARVMEFEHFNTIAWVKLRKDGADLRIGLGHTYRGAWEPILCLSKGKRRALQNKSTPNVMFAEANGGSKKPAVLYEKLARASTKEGGSIVDPFCGTDPLGRAGLEEYETISSDILGPAEVTV